MDYNSLLIDALRAKQYITPLEKDILDTLNCLIAFIILNEKTTQQTIKPVVWSIC